jgi:hypothetical protein
MYSLLMACMQCIFALTCLLCVHTINLRLALQLPRTRLASPIKHKLFGAIMHDLMQPILDFEESMACNPAAFLNIIAAQRSVRKSVADAINTPMVIANKISREIFDSDVNLSLAIEDEGFLLVDMIS